MNALLITNGIQFIDKNDSRGLLFSQGKRVSNQLSTVSDEHLRILIIANEESFNAYLINNIYSLDNVRQSQAQRLIIKANILLA